MEGTLTTPSKRRCADSPQTRESLISEWVAKLAINAGASLGAKTQAVYKNLWVEGLADLPTDVLHAAFQRTLKDCAYWPIKVADIRKHVSHAESNATVQAAEQAWERVLELRRVYWNPDMPGGFSRGMPMLDERARQAARAAGVFRDHESVEALHVWAKKKFIESFIAWGELKQDEFLLPDGEVRNLLANAAQKFLPPPANYEERRARGLAHSEKLKTLGCNEPYLQRAVRAITRPAMPGPPTRSIEEQKAILRRRGFLS